jgi:CMP-N-acetylneuraminic acid synthetase
MSEAITAFVPMKGHSERVPRKNFRDFNGKPLFHWILEALNRTESVDRTVVDTDAERIAEEASERFGADIIDRPEHLRGDEVSMNRILLHDVEETEADVYLQTHCTNPLLRPTTIDEAVDAFLADDEHDSLFSATPLQTRLWDEEVTPVNHERDRLLPTQELPLLYEENSNIYLFTQDSIERRENRIGDDPGIFEMDRREAVDIDEMIDFEFDEFLHQREYGTEPTFEEVYG